MLDKTVPSDFEAAALATELREELQSLVIEKVGMAALMANGSTYSLDPKAKIRELYAERRTRAINRWQLLSGSAYQKLSSHFANGCEVFPGNIRPRFEIVQSGRLSAELFRFATLTWSVPVSSGYGRRIRLLVWDDSNGKLIGVIGLGDPVFNLGVRDAWVGWTSSERKERLVGMMDAFVLGAVPPYNMLLCGKLLACLVRSRDLLDIHNRKYGGKIGIISGEKKDFGLLAVTTTSALGRSSVYNRLRLSGVTYFARLGYTSGFGHFHISDETFERLREYLRIVGHSYAGNHAFGSGPNWKFRAIAAALRELGLPRELLIHGITREVFVASLAQNAQQVLAGKLQKGQYSNLLTAEQISQLAIERWVRPRGERHAQWRSWTRDMLRTTIFL